VSTKKEICEQLEKVDTKFSIKDPSKKLRLTDFASFLSFKNLPSNEKINTEVTSHHNKKGEKVKMTPKNAVKYAGVDLNVSDSVDDDSEFDRKYMFVGLNCAVRKNNYNHEKWHQFHDQEQISHTFDLAAMTNREEFAGSYITDILKNTLDSKASSVGENFLVKMESKNPGIFLSGDIKVLSEERSRLDALRYNRDVKANNNRKKPRDSSTITPARSSEELEESVKEYQKAYKNSADLFIKECEIIKPEQLIVFGDTAKIVMDNMLKAKMFDKSAFVKKLVEEAIETTHYSKQGKGTKTVDFMKHHLNVLSEQVGLSELVGSKN